ncbi:hypothetical protein CKJ66_26740 [Mycobacterium avium]|uniref:Uncharacterized protein n=1 Tax=Mycobacterium avium TaxID=1764 RepID=A0A2A2ZB97_MYCAV|nr:hypothetical protein [Mycobacterium avium]PBA23822.1 hypothetical protein CKJ66_26740 [Mycobacterium avium]
MGTQYRVEYTITESEDGFETENEVGFGSSGTWDSIEQCGHIVLSDLQNETWETEGPTPTYGDRAL